MEKENVSENVATIVEMQSQRIKELEQELRIVRGQLQRYQTREMDEIARRRREVLGEYERNSDGDYDEID